MPLMCSTCMRLETMAAKSRTGPSTKTHRMVSQHSVGKVLFTIPWSEHIFAYLPAMSPAKEVASNNAGSKNIAHC